MNSSQNGDLDLQLAHRGWGVATAVVEDTLLDQLSQALESALALRERIREQAGVEGNNDGTAHHVLADHPAFIEILRRLQPFDPLIRRFFGGNYILNSYGGVINRKSVNAYTHNVHRDVRFWSEGRSFMLNVLVMLDDFTLHNGATYLLAGSHKQNAKPDPAGFDRDADRATGSRGSLLFFDSRVWHATGRNTTDEPRRALTLTLTSPFFKQQLDYPRLLGRQVPELGEPFITQLVGYNARVPSSLDEYYVPLAQRFYQRGQDD